MIPRFTPKEWGEVQRLADAEEIQRIRRSLKEWNTFVSDFNNGRTSPTLYYDYFQQLLREKNNSGSRVQSDQDKPRRFQPISEPQGQQMAQSQKPGNTLFPQNSFILTSRSQREGQPSNARVKTVRFNEDNLPTYKSSTALVRDMVEDYYKRSNEQTQPTGADNTPNMEESSQNMSHIAIDPNQPPGITEMAYYYKGLAAAKSKGTRGNYGKVAPPILVIDPELPTSGYRAWKKQWFDFQKRHGMSNEDAMSFLTGDSISYGNYRRLILVCESTESIFQVLDTQFGDLTNELRIIRKNIL